MSLKVLKQQLKDIAEEERMRTPEPKRQRKEKALKKDKFTRSRKVMKKNTKPRTQVESVESSVSRIKDEVAYAREREEENMKWNMKIIDAVSTVNGTDVMNRYLRKKGLIPEKKSKSSKKSAQSYRIKSKAETNTPPSDFQWIS